MSTNDSLIGRAIADWVDRRAAGEHPALDEYCAQYPDIAAELRPQLEAFESMSGRVTADLPAAASRIPDQLSGYRVVKELGSGGMGSVYLAMDDKLGRPVAIKMLAARHQANERLRERFLQEARALAKLSHPNIVRIYGLGPDHEPPHFVMEYVEGRPFTDAVAKLSLMERMRLLLPVVRAVEFLHRRSFVHRDLKPANILVDQTFETKVVDFGLALEVENESEGRLTRSGEALGTPWYMSPEQVRGEHVDARTDVFSLGVVLYEMLTGSPPFRERDWQAQVRSVCEVEPALPRRLNREVPGALQDICLQALEKDANRRYATAAELARDLERFLAGEPVLAAPSSYAVRAAAQIRAHQEEIERWQADHVVLPLEYERLKHAYAKLSEREDSWILEARSLSLPQVALYFGGWMLLAGALLVSLLQRSGWNGPAAAVLVWVAAAVPLALGVRYWRERRLRIAIGFLLSFCLMLPFAWLFTLPAFPQREQWEPLLRWKDFRRVWDLRLITNAQLWWALLLSMPAYFGLRRFTRAPVFSLLMAVSMALLSIVTLLRLGMLEWLSEDTGRVFLNLLPAAFVFFASGFALERSGKSSDAGYFYPVGVGFTLLGLSGLAGFHDPYAQWLKETFPFTRGQVEYLFLINAGIYLVLQELCDRFGTDLLKRVGRAFRFVLPGHVLGSLLFLGMSASVQQKWQAEARLFEVLLPLVAAGFVFVSIPKQMKNFFAMGLLFFAIGVIRLANDWLSNQAAWPLVLVVCGTGLMLLAANYARVFLKFRRGK
ncbi:MAG: protein kinase [Acidobacteria bacterium]|nr:protein kinase [Acidobacteriota bacterium]